jgi:hypothetical protein
MIREWQYGKYFCYFLKFFEHSNPVPRICQMKGKPFSTDPDRKRAAEFIPAPRIRWNNSSDK